MYVVEWRRKNVHIYELYNSQGIRHDSLLGWQNQRRMKWSE